MKKFKFWSMIMLMAMSLPLMVSCGGDDSGDESSVPPSEYPENPDPYDVLNFKDLQVAAICIANFDLNKDGKITYAEAAAVKNIGELFRRSNIEFFDEFRYFTGLSTIPRLAFASCTALSSITIPNGVKTIDEGAFENCSRLTSIIIPNSVTTIKDHSFACEDLSSIVIGSGLTTITGYPFNKKNLTSIKVESGNPKYDSRENCNALIETATNEIIIGCGKTIIPNSVTSIRDYAFANSQTLTSISIPNSVTSIGSSAFSGCTGLTSITVGNSVTSINDDAFHGCSGLTSITVEEGNSIYDSRDNCNAIIETSTNTLIAGCKKSTIPNSVTSIGISAFSGCSGLTSVSIPNSVTSIGSKAFYRCSGLTSITIPNSVTSIGYEAFYGCSGLTSVSIPNSVTSIGDEAFYYCKGLTSVTIPNSVTSIGSLAFWYCSGLTSVTIGSGVASIEHSAFHECSSLTSIHCKSKTPPSLNSSWSVENVYHVFDDKTYTSATLYVPQGSKETYKSDGEWNKFRNIVEE